MNKETIEIMWVNVNIQGKEKKKRFYRTNKNKQLYTYQLNSTISIHDKFTQRRHTNSSYTNG